MEDINATTNIIATFLKRIVQEAISEHSKAYVKEKEKNKICYNSKEVSELYGFNINTLAAWRNQGKGPAYIKEGGLIMYKKSDIENYIQSKRIKTIDQQD